MDSTALHIEAIVEEEKARIIDKYGFYHSDHEAFAVLKEEVEEACEEMFSVTNSMDEFWQHIRQDDEDNAEIMQSIEKHGIELIKEARQIVAIARKYQSGQLKKWVAENAHKLPRRE